MAIGTDQPCVPIERAAAARPQDALVELVARLATNLRPAVSRERRHFQRTGLPFLLKLTPLDDAGRAIEEAQTVVVGRDVSPRGISFFHHEPLPERRAHISLDHPLVGRFTVEVDVNRCRFHQLGWYESGARLVRAVELFLPEVPQAG